MPLWLIFHPEGTFKTPEDKQALATDITSLYTGGGLPAFYVVIQFITQSPSSIFVGGKNPPIDKPFIRFAVDHLAVHFSKDEERRLRVMNRLEELIKPHVADKGYDWELSVDETPRELWHINGIAPPPWQSEAEKMWARENRAVEWKEMA